MISKACLLNTTNLSPFNIIGNKVNFSIGNAKKKTLMLNKNEIILF